MIFWGLLEQRHSISIGHQREDLPVPDPDEHQHKLLSSFGCYDVRRYSLDVYVQLVASGWLLVLCGRTSKHRSKWRLCEAEEFLPACFVAVLVGFTGQEPRRRGDRGYDEPVRSTVHVPLVAVNPSLKSFLQEYLDSWLWEHHSVLAEPVEHRSSEVALVGHLDSVMVVLR